MEFNLLVTKTTTDINFSNLSPVRELSIILATAIDNKMMFKFLL